MSIDLEAVKTFGMRTYNNKVEAKKPILIGSDGQVQTCEPAGARPGRWTRFKAALVGVPLIGRMEAVRHAGLQIRTAVEGAALLARAAQFSDEFKQQLTEQFGAPIASRAISTVLQRKRKQATPPATLSSRKAVRILRQAESDVNGDVEEGDAAAVGWKNDRAVLTRWRLRDHQLVGQYARIAAAAKYPDYFRTALKGSDLEEIESLGNTVLRRLNGLGIPLQKLQPLLVQFGEALFNARLHERQKIAMEGLTELDAQLNRLIVEHSRPEPAEPSSSEPRPVALNDPAPGPEAPPLTPAAACEHPELDPMPADRGDLE